MFGDFNDFLDWLSHYVEFRFLGIVSIHPTFLTQVRIRVYTEPTLIFLQQWYTMCFNYK